MMSGSYSWLAFSSALFITGIGGALFNRRRGWWIALLCALLGSLVAVAGVIPVFLRPPDAVHTLPLWRSSWIEHGMPRLRMELRVDRLSAFFIVLIGTFAAIVAIYSFAALKARHYIQRQRSIAATFTLFVWSTLLVVVVNDIFSLIATLEIMTLAFAYLTLYRHYHYCEAPDAAPDAESARNAWLAPRVYLIVSHTSTVFLVVALLLLAFNAGSLSFDELRASAGSLPPIMATLIFILMLFGTGIRAGLTPFHFWVPLVHPASPTTTHAFSLGIAIKVAVYLMLRCFFQFLVPQTLWGYIVLLIAVGTAITTVWYAIASHDLKTALAYHSVENIGIIVAGIGVALIYADPNVALIYADPNATLVNRALAGSIASLALVAALYHMLNHAVFKGLLYLCTGAIDSLTGQVVDIERLGGLIKLYPWTSGAFLLGALAIAGFPPLNGFVSEWLTLQALLHSLGALSPISEQIGGVIITLISTVLLVAAFALTVFCFLKISGLALLGPPRSTAQMRATWSKGDAPPAMLAMMGLLAALCLALGVMPGVVIIWLSGIVAIFPNITGSLATESPQGWSARWTGLSLHISSDTPIYSAAPVPSLPILMLLLVFIALWLVVLLLRLLNRRRRTLRPADSWAGGAPPEPARTRPVGASLSYLIRWAVGNEPAHPTKEQARAIIPYRFVLSESDTYPQRVTEIFRVGLNYCTDRVLRASEGLGAWIQNGDLRRYLFYIFLAAATALAIFLLYILILA